jgi:hypothetical protein
MRLGYLNLVPYLNFFKTLHFNKFDVICDFSGDFSALPLIFAYLAGVKHFLPFIGISRDSFKINLWRKAYKTIMIGCPFSKHLVLTTQKLHSHIIFQAMLIDINPTFFVSLME